MTTISSDRPEYESIAPSTPFERLVLARLEAIEAENRELHTVVKSQAETIVTQAEEIAGLREEVARERAFDRRRIASLEESAKPSSKPSSTPQDTVSERTESHIQHIRALLLQADHNRLTVKFLAPRLGVTKQRTWAIVHEMRRRGLVNVIGDPHHKQRQLVELRPYFGTASET